mmetsp:Transcript_47535/g.97176  ORF Transcript_47535/g.97176 Transcript_47535/m.97176 type:complete len:603 (+) Transcript_47535:387-2195(+)
MPTTKDFKLEELSQYFHLPEKAVAKELGICLTSLKKLCRSYGITRWPFRKLKSIQRTLAKVQDESSQPGISAQLSAAGLVLECGEGSSNGAGEAAEAAAVASESPANARPPEAAAGGGAGNAAGRTSVAKKRKPYQLGGRTLLLTEEEKSIYELTIGKTGGQTSATELKPIGGASPAPSAHSSQQRSATPDRGAANAQAQTWIQSEASSLPSPPNSSAFSCQAVGATLQIRNWSTLWTQEHLQKRLLEPLGGQSISLVPQSNLATLHFDAEKTAQRAELICRAAAAAAEKNLKLQSQQSSRVQSPSLQGYTPAESPAGSNTSETGDGGLQLLMPGSVRGGQSSSELGGSDLKLKLGSSSSNKGKVKLEIPSAGGQGSSPNLGSGGSATSPMFKSTPTTPPTSFTNYLFEPTSQYDGVCFGALLMNPSSGMQFDVQESGGSCVEVPSMSMMGGPDDMTVALMAGSSMSGSQLAESVDEEILASGEGMFIARSPPNTAGSGEGGGGSAGTDSSGGSVKVDSNGADGASAATILMGGPVSGAAQVLLSGQPGSMPGSMPTSPLLPPSSTSPLLPPSTTSLLLPPPSTSPLLLPADMKTPPQSGAA